MIFLSFTRIFSKKRLGNTFMFLSSHEWTFGRTRYTGGTHSTQVAGECFHKFFEFSKTFTSVVFNSTETGIYFFFQLLKYITTSTGNSNIHYHILAIDLFIVTSVSAVGDWLASNLYRWGHGLKQSKIYRISQAIFSYPKFLDR